MRSIRHSAVGFPVLVAFLLLSSRIPVSGQSPVDSWQTPFSLAGPSDLTGISGDGKKAVAVSWNDLRLFVDGQWKQPIPFSGLHAVLHEGAIWGIHRVFGAAKWTGASWTTMDASIGSWRSPEEGYRSHQLLSLDGDLYVLPQRLVWDGRKFQPTLPDSVEPAYVTAVSRRGDWILATGSIVDPVLYLIRNDSLIHLPEIGTPFLPVWPVITDVAFDGDRPVVFGSESVYRMENGAWRQIIDGLSDDGSFFELLNSRPIRPLRFGDRLVVAMRGTPLFLGPGDPDEFPHSYSCQNVLYELRGDRWYPLFAPGQGRIRQVAYDGNGSYLVMGDFSPWGISVPAHDLLRYDSAGFSAVTGQPYGHTGVAGEIEDVVLHRGVMYAGGASLTVHDLEPAPLIRYEGRRWHREEQVAGRVIALHEHEGVIYAAGEITIGDETGMLARRQSTGWELVREVQHTVTALASGSQGVLVAGGVTRGGSDDGGYSVIRGTAVTTSTVKPRFQVTGVAELSGEIYLADRSGTLFRLEGGRLEVVARAAGGPVVWEGSGSRPIETYDVDSIVRPSIRTIQEHLGRLYVGGTFDSIAGVAAGNLASFDGTEWRAVDSGVTSGSHLPYDNCTGLDRAAYLEDHIHTVSSLASAGRNLVVGGVFSHVGARAEPALDPYLNSATREELGGMEVSFPAALYDPFSGEWFETSRSEGDRVSAISWDENRLAIAGHFRAVGAVPAEGIALSDQFMSAPRLEPEDDPSLDLVESRPIPGHEEPATAPRPHK